MSLLGELRRRNVIRMAGLYLVGAWLIVQVAATLLPMFGAPEWMARTVVILLAIGFVPMLVVAWVFELTPEGLKRDAEVPAAESIAPQTARRMDRMIIVVLIAALSYFAINEFVVEPAQEAADAEQAEAPVETSAETSTGRAAVSEPQQASIAVLPFADMSEARDQEYFSDGLSEEILNLLAQIRDLKVIGRTSSFAFKGRNEDLRTIGDTLGVAYLLEGSVRKAGDDLRITAKLIEAASGSELWSQRYDRKLENVFAIQSEIAASIADALKINLIAVGQAAPTAQVAASLPAYDLFLQARRLIHGRTRSGLEVARGLLDQALELDPNYAPALAAQALTLLLLNDTWAGYGDIPKDQAIAMAQPLVEKALALDPDLAEAHAVQGQVFNHLGDFPRAEAALSKALSLNPNLPDALHWQAILLEVSGRFREILAVRQRLDAIDPLNVANLWSLNGILRTVGKPSDAQAVTVRMLRTFPDNPQTFGAQAFDLMEAGRLAEAQVPAARMLALGSNWAPALNAGIYYVLGDFERVLSFQGIGGVKSWALIALDRNDEAVAEARERFRAAPDDRGAAQSLFATLSLAGRHAEVLALYREQWGDLDALEAFFFSHNSEPFAAIAAAQRATGDQVGFAETLLRWGKRMDFQREQGSANAGFVMTEARYFALAGEQASALKAITQAIDLGFRDPLLGRDPAFAELLGDAAFQAQVTRMTELINIERAKLGMAPLP